VRTPLRQAWSDLRLWGVGGRRVLGDLRKGDEMSMRSTMRRAGAIVIAGVAAVLIAAAPGAGSATASTTPARGARAVDDPSAQAARKHLSPRVRRQLRKAHRLLHRGHERKARRVGRQIRKRRVPMRRRNRSGCLTINACLGARAARSRGCGTAAGHAVYDVDVLGFDAFKPSLAQTNCWKRGRITRLGGISVQSNLTTFGSVINIPYEGVVYADAYWRRWRGRRHGKRVLIRVLRFTGCTGTPGVGGCLFPKDWNVGLALVMRGDGAFGFGSS
jgi:hypothetical protein